MSSVLRNLGAIAWLLLSLLLSACYHMRAEPTPIKVRTLSVKGTSEAVHRRIRQIVESEWHRRVLEEGESGRMLITAPYDFYTDTGYGQPAGGRKYYMQLQIELEPANSQVKITIRPHNYEIRTSYAYGLDGQVKTLHKHYPYEEYPGMFDLAPLEQELDLVTAVLGQKLKE